ncbi:MAG: M20/M25/M40 family metallo-hydrolase, partial [Candidatus Marinimicrobia bacterium]|nr:M20/M25/M40 family metallo-hydrolase [Candidatus Neomarinimicrobiota bacterium]
MNRSFYLSIIVSALFFGCSGGKEMAKQTLTLDELLSGSVLPAAHTVNSDGNDAFEAYLDALVGSATDNASKELAEELVSLQEVKKIPAENLNTASVVLRNYVVKRYGDAIVKDLQTMLGFRTYAEEGRENWMAPEFLRQREWLESRADELGLGFKTYDGRVDEFSLEGPEAVLAVLTHGDVQGVEGQDWSSSPWTGEIVDGKIIGRGTQDDKGAVVMTYYVL